MAGLLNNLSIDTGGTEEEVAEGLEAALGVKVDGYGKDEDAGKSEEEGVGKLRALGSPEFLSQDADPSRTTLVDARNGLNELSRLAIMWTVQHRWPVGARFAFNCYRHWAQILLLQLGGVPVTILSREGVTQGDPLKMVLYGITLVPLAQDIRSADPRLLSIFYADDAALTVCHDKVHSY